MLTPFVDSRPGIVLPLSAPPQVEVEKLPFVVRFVRDEHEFEQVCELRHMAYARRSVYQPGFVEALREVDETTEQRGRVTLGAFDRDTDRLLGTVRLALSTKVANLLPTAVGRPAIARLPFTFVDRFAVRPGVNRRVGPTLMKSLWLWSKAQRSEALVALATRTLIGHYARWGGMQLQEGGEPLHVPEHLTEPVYLLGTHLKDVLTIIGRNNPGFLPFLQRSHSEIQIVPSVGHYHA